MRLFHLGGSVHHPAVVGLPRVVAISDPSAATLWSRFRKSRAACIGEPIGGCATRRTPPTLKRTTCWRN